MVSFTCNYCQDVVKKPKVQSHAYACGCDTFTCVDCMQLFDLGTVKGHTSCVTEEEKYQGKWKEKLRNGSKAAKLAEAPRSGIGRQPRAPMNDLSSSDDSSDGDWVTQSSGKGAGASNGHQKPSAIAYRKRPCPGLCLSSSDDEGMGRGVPTAPVAPAHKKAKTVCSASSTPSSALPEAAPVLTERSPANWKPGAKKGTASPAASVPHRRPKEVKDEGECKVTHPGKKDTPLLLPRSTMSRDCMVPTFLLGTSEEVADIVADVLRNSGVSSMRTKDVAKELVERYAKRIAKSVHHAVETAAELGALKIDSEGNVSVA
ncbi:LYAR-type C2HC zinc finger containing protein, putative [Leishmania donovani]|uniref:LYAR-type C2HC zinc finger containing protein, putative n=1 Tax=Leishmania donovani TaxID=5661 RepID=A0A3Q8IRD2_LEIDO|nr:LYAR-type C2HC zinc finger containing protein, putative [Leishmania donovani]